MFVPREYFERVDHRGIKENLQHTHTRAYNLELSLPLRKERAIDFPTTPADDDESVKERSQIRLTERQRSFCSSRVRYGSNTGIQTRDVFAAAI